MYICNSFFLAFNKIIIVIITLCDKRQREREREREREIKYSLIIHCVYTIDIRDV